MRVRAAPHQLNAAFGGRQGAAGINIARRRSCPSYGVGFPVVLTGWKTPTGMEAAAARNCATMTSLPGTRCALTYDSNTTIYHYIKWKLTHDEVPCVSKFPVS